MEIKYTPLQKQVLKLVKELDLDEILIVGQKNSQCEFASKGSSLSNVSMIFKTIQFILKEEKEFFDFLTLQSKEGKDLVDKLLEVDFLINKFVINSKNVSLKNN